MSQACDTNLCTRARRDCVIPLTQLDVGSTKTQARTHLNKATSRSVLTSVSGPNKLVQVVGIDDDAPGPNVIGTRCFVLVHARTAIDRQLELVCARDSMCHV